MKPFLYDNIRAKTVMDCFLGHLELTNAPNQIIASRKKNNATDEI